VCASWQSRSHLGQLIDAATGAHLWADRFDSQLDDIFDLQDRVTSSVIGALSPQLERAEIEAREAQTDRKPSAYDYYLRALACFHKFTLKRTLKRSSSPELPAGLDPEFAAAYALGARC